MRKTWNYHKNFIKRLKNRKIVKKPAKHNVTLVGSYPGGCKLRIRSWHRNKNNRIEEWKKLIHK